MRALMDMAQHLSPIAACVLIASFWQGALLTAGVALALRYVQHVTPAVRMWIWTMVLLALLILPGCVQVASPGAAPVHAEMHVAAGWSAGLLMVWLAGALFRGVRLLLDGLRLRRIARQAVPVTVEASLQRVLAGGRRRAVLCVSTEVDRPSVTGLVRPRILLPDGLLETLTVAELEHVVLHEMEHLRRGDDWLNLLQQISLMLLPLNPALLWVNRRLCRERELACDDGVLRTTHARNAYAACLVKLAEDSLVRKGVALAMSVLGMRGRETELVGRVRRILAGPERGVGRFGAAPALLGIGVLGGMLLLARSPQWVSFDAVSSPPVQTAFAMGTGQALGPTRMPARATGRYGEVRPVLAEAVVGEETAGTLHPAVALATRHQPTRRRALLARVAASRPRFKFEARTVAAVAVDATQRARQAALFPGRIVITHYEVSQPVYAAVPWRNGWLIVQL